VVDRSARFRKGPNPFLRKYCREQGQLPPPGASGATSGWSRITAMILGTFTGAVNSSLCEMRRIDRIAVLHLGRAGAGGAGGARIIPLKVARGKAAV